MPTRPLAHQSGRAPSVADQRVTDVAAAEDVTPAAASQVALAAV
jgi:hypothetical protein